MTNREILVQLAKRVGCGVHDLLSGDIRMRRARRIAAMYLLAEGWSYEKVSSILGMQMTSVRKIDRARKSQKRS